MTRRELLAWVAALAVAIGVLPFVGGGVLWTHPLWLDELCCTVYPVEHAATPVQVVANIAHRQDFGPPLLHLIVWAVARVGGGITPTLLRSIALVFVIGALLFTHATLRRRFDATTSALGAATLLASPLLLTHAFEGRFYGPWLMFAAGYAWSLGMTFGRRRTWQSLFAICLVTIHWFGAISLMILASASIASDLVRRAPLTAAVRRVAVGVAAGGVAVLACVPLLLPQFAGSSAARWIAPLSVQQLQAMARTFFLTNLLALAVGLLVVDALRPDRPGLRGTLGRIRDTAREPGSAALASLVLMPLALVVVSVVLQPSILDRYLILTLLCWPPLVALAVEPLGLRAKLLAAGVVSATVVPTVNGSIRDRQRFTDLVAQDSAAYARVARVGIPFAYPFIHEMYPVLGSQRGKPTVARFLMLPEATLRALYPSDRLAWLRDRMLVEARSGVSHERIYGFPSTITRDSLARLRRFAIVSSDLRFPGGAKQSENWGRIVFPNHRVVRVDDRISFFELDRSPEPRAQSPKPQ